MYNFLAASPRGLYIFLHNTRFLFHATLFISLDGLVGMREA